MASGRSVAKATSIYGPDANIAVVPQLARSAAAASNSGAPANGSINQTPVPITSVLQGWQGSFLAAPIVWLFGLVLFLVAWKLIEEHRGGRENFAKLRVDATNVLKTTVMVLIGFIVLRFMFTKISVPGLSSTVLYGIGSGS